MPVPDASAPSPVGHGRKLLLLIGGKQQVASRIDVGVLQPVDMLPVDMLPVENSLTRAVPAQPTPAVLQPPTTHRAPDLLLLSPPRR